MRRPRDRRARSRPGRRVPEPFAAAVAYVLRQRSTSRSSASSARRRRRRLKAARTTRSTWWALTHAEHKYAARDLGRHEAARRHRPRAGDGAEGAAARRAVRRARRADARAAAGRADADRRARPAARC